MAVVSHSTQWVLIGSGVIAIGLTVMIAVMGGLGALSLLFCFVFYVGAAALIFFLRKKYRGQKAKVSAQQQQVRDFRSGGPMTGWGSEYSGHQAPEGPPPTLNNTMWWNYRRNRPRFMLGFVVIGVPLLLISATITIWVLLNPTAAEIGNFSCGGADDGGECILSGSFTVGEKEIDRDKIEFDISGEPITNDGRVKLEETAFNYIHPKPGETYQVHLGTFNLKNEVSDTTFTVRMYYNDRFLGSDTVDAGRFYCFNC